MFLGLFLPTLPVVDAQNEPASEIPTRSASGQKCPKAKIVKLLRQLGDNTIIPPKAPPMDSSVPRTVGANAAHNLAALRGCSIEPLMSAMSNSDFSVRKNALNALVEMNDRRATGVLMRAVAGDFSTDPEDRDRPGDCTLRAAGAFGLFLQPDPRARPVLSRALDVTCYTEPSDTARNAQEPHGPELPKSCRSGEVYYRTALPKRPFICNATQEWQPYWNVFATWLHKKAIQALRDPDPQAIHSLVRIIAEEPSVAPEASLMLQEATHQSFGTDAAKWTAWWEKNHARYETAVPEPSKTIPPE